jgi:alkylation response protein AidB-like acyl-CoA dehydrogenase
MIGEDTSLTDEEREYLTFTIQTLEEEVLVDRLDEDHLRDLDHNEETEADWRAYVKRVGERDLLGVTVPEDHNGAGLGYLEAALTVQAAAYAGCIMHACQVSMTQHGGRIIADHGTDHLRETYLEPWLAGELIGSQAFTEPGSGTDLAHMTTRANRDGDTWIINGEKRFVDFAGYADFFSPSSQNGRR